MAKKNILDKTIAQQFAPFDPERRALEFRKCMFRINDREKRAFLITNITKTEEARDTAVWGDFFRPREYIKRREYTSRFTVDWIGAPLYELWSPKYIGLDERGIQKLEFQNPPYVAAFRLGGDPREYNNVFTVQVSGCNYLCSFCYVPRDSNNPIIAPADFFDAAQILDNFQRIQEARSDYPIRVIRLSGGEVTSIIPEMIVDVSDEIELRRLSNKIYLFADSNLSTIEYARALTDDLRRIAMRKNFSLIGCLKAIGNGQIGSEDFSLITGASPRHFSTQFDALDFYINEIRADFYLYLLPCVFGSEEQVKEKLAACFYRLRLIDSNLPLRANFLHIAQQRYKAAITNLVKAEAEGRQLAKYNELFVLNYWHNELLKSYYSSDLLDRYRCQIKLGGEN